MLVTPPDPGTPSVIQAAELIRSLAALAWPVVVWLLASEFSTEIKQLLKRLREGEVFGTKVKLDPLVTEVRRELVGAKIEIAENPPLTASPAAIPALDVETPQVGEPDGETPALVRPPEPAPDDDSGGQDVPALLRQVRNDPYSAITRLSGAIDRELRSLLAATGHLPRNRFPTLKEAVEILVSQNLLPAHLVRTISGFVEIRSRIIHGGRVEDQMALETAAFVGYDLLETIAGLPREDHVVVEADLALYADENCTAVVEGITGVKVQTLRPTGGPGATSVFPTSMTWYKPGISVAWQWNGSKVWGPCWYRERNSSRPALAFTKAAEFVGTPMKQILDLS